MTFVTLVVSLRFSAAGLPVESRTARRDDVTIPIGVFHGVAGVARATPGLAEQSSAGNGIDVSR